MMANPIHQRGVKRSGSLSAPFPSLPPAAALFGSELVDLTAPRGAVSNFKRKRVRFEEDNETRTVKRRVADLPHLPSSQLSKCEKSQLWMTQTDYENTLKAVLKDVLAAKDLRNEASNNLNQVSMLSLIHI